MNVLVILIFFISSFFHVNALTSSVKNGREALQVIIGGGGDVAPAYPPQETLCPPPPPPEPLCPTPIPPPPPPPKPNPTKPPPPPKNPKPPKPPSPTPNDLLTSAISVIQRFKKTITSDPSGITKTWVGKGICKDSTKYIGFICNKNKVVAVNFNGRNLKGNPLSLKDFINGIPTLEIFHSNSNNFTGEIPNNISTQSIPNLFELDLSNNKYVGFFPKAVLGATRLTYLDLRFNQIEGPVDPQVFTLDLDILFLNNNQFSGKIPENFGRTAALFLTLANNKFIGEIPKSIGYAKGNLLEVLFFNNQLTGCLPYEIGMLKLASVFDASKNKLTGPIPQSFGCLVQMEVMDLSYNQLYGEVPETLCNISSLEELTLKYNYFTQIGPECRKLVEENVLNIGMNCIIDLENQRKPEECEAFFLQKRNCRDMKSLSYIPCKLHEFSSRNSSAGRAHTGDAKARSTTYAAVKKPHL
ncbi:hypothetical protein EJD97_009609 [Solanum chilense]|uniref:Leucine-rich repeat-containing N-terminal plant-type domain-containing protein n=1 Tax=Solanum chilense TaxID=4083 RepID=A0A6N2BMN8_SOLCI|nr:hypothetical protein EJD97_009609 [Solanum chilense]